MYWAFMAPIDLILDVDAVEDIDGGGCVKGRLDGGETIAGWGCELEMVVG